MALKETSVKKYKLLEMKIRNERSYMDQLFENSPEAMVISDTSGHIVRINNEFTRLFGFKNDECIGKNLDNLLSSSRSKQDAMQSTKKTASGKKVRFESERFHKNGKSVMVSVMASPIIIKGKVEAIYGIYRDITDQKRAEESLRESEEKFKTLFKFAPDGYYLHDLKGRFVDGNKKAEQLIGYKRDELIGKNFLKLKLLSAQDISKASKLLTKNIMGKATGPDEFVLNRKDGSKIAVEIHSRPVKIKKRALVLSSVRDISDRKRMEEALLTEKSYLEKLFEGAQEAIVMTENNGRVMSVNREFERMFGYKKKEAVGQFIDDLVAPKELIKEASQATNNVANRKKISFETVRRRKDGSHIQVSVLGTPITINKNQIAVYGVYQDITDRKEMEKKTLVEKKRAQKYLDIAGVLLVAIDLNHRVALINKKGCEILGYKEREVIGKNWFNHFIPKTNRNEIKRIFTQLMNGKLKGVEYFENSILTKKGEERIIAWHNSVLSDDAGKIMGTLSSGEDITEQKQIEKAFLEEKSYLEQLFESAQEAIVMTDNDGRVQRINREFSKMFGFSKKESIGRFIDDLLAPPDMLEEATNITRTSADGGKMATETVRQRKDGSLINVSLMSSPIIVNNTQKAVYAIYRDITERKQAEEEILKAKEAALSSSQAKSEFLANMSHEIRTPMNGIIGMTELALDTDIDPIQRDYLESIKTSADSLLEIINNVLDFSRIEAKKVELENIQFKLRDFINDVVSSISILAEKKGLEIICNISPSTPEYAKGDPGKIRQIMVNLINNAIKFTKKGEIVVSVKVTSKSADKVYLKFSISDTGIGIPAKKRELIFQSFTQADGSTTRKYGGSGLGLSISASLVDIMNGKIWVESQVNKGSAFHFNIGLDMADKISDIDVPGNIKELKNLPVLIVDDNETNQRILKDMLLNWKMKPQVSSSGKQALDLLQKSQKVGKPFSLILVDVQMPEMDGFQLVEHIKKEIVKYSPTIMMLTSLGIRGDSERCRQLGISAYLVKPVKQSELLEAILLLIGKKDTKKKQTGIITRHTIRERRYSYKILVAEDNIINQKLIERFLEKEGHHVSIVENGKQVISILKSKKFDLILMDVQMPEMDGLEATSRIRSNESSKKKHIPIIAMTAHAMKGDRDRCLSAGMDDYISKPIDFEKLRKAIAQAIKNKST